MFLQIQTDIYIITFLFSEITQPLESSMCFAGNFPTDLGLKMDAIKTEGEDTLVRSDVQLPRASQVNKIIMKIYLL